MGIYAGISDEMQQRQYTDRELFSRYLKRIIPYKKSIIYISLFIFISAIAELVNPLLVGSIVDDLLQGSPNFIFIIFVGLSYLFFSILIWVMSLLQRRELGNVVPFFLEKLRMDIFNKLQEQDMAFFDHHQSGALNTRISNDALDFSDTTALITESAGNFLISILTFLILLWLNLTLALIALAALPVLFILMYSLRKLARKVSRTYRKAIENVNNAMIESIEGIQVCKSYGQESMVSKKFDVTNRHYFQSTFKLTSVTHLWRPILNVVASITLAIILGFSSQFVLEGIANAGLITMFVLYLQRFFRPIMVLSTFFPQLSSGMAAYERILEILDSKPQLKQKSTAFDVDGLKGEIEFNNVDFYYHPGEWVFENFTLHIPKGERLAIVGHTGAGKTSLVSLLARFYEFQAGSIKIDGIDIRNMTLASFRRNLGIVQQDVFLFSGTIEENIRYGRRDASKEDLWNAIKAVHAEELTEYLPDGINTQVGERGKNLSTGQRQLISFARALLTDPKILILDEATSSVDAYTESIIQEALEVLLSNRTSIVVAHRLSTVVNSDRIIVLDHGQIIEEGNHKTLLLRGGKYAELYKMYFEHQSLDWHS